MSSDPAGGNRGSSHAADRCRGIGATDSIDPLAGFYYVENITDRIEAEVDEYIQKIDAMGGTLSAIEQGYIQKEIQNSAYRFQKELETNERVYVGINKYTMEEPPPCGLLKVDMSVGEKKAAELKDYREKGTTRNGRPPSTSCVRFPAWVKT